MYDIIILINVESNDQRHLNKNYYVDICIYSAFVLIDYPWSKNSLDDIVW